MSEKLPLCFYQRKTETVARELLGKKLVRVYKGKRISGIITEVEAYLGIEDLDCLLKTRQKSLSRKSSKQPVLASLMRANTPLGP